METQTGAYTTPKFTATVHTVGLSILARVRSAASRLAQMRSTSSQPDLVGSEVQHDAPPHTVDIVPASPDATQPLDLSPLLVEEKPQDPFVKDALQWLIFNSQNSNSIDIAINALTIGKVKVPVGDLKDQIILHLFKHLSDRFIPGKNGIRLELLRHPDALRSAMDYINCMSYMAGGTSDNITSQLEQLVKSYDHELVIRLGLSLASLADQENLLPEAGQHVAFWLSAYIKCYLKTDLYLNEDVLSVLIDGLAIVGCNVHAPSAGPPNQQTRAKILAIPILIRILWRVSHMNHSALRASISVNLAAFALTANLPYPFSHQNFRSAARSLVYEYRNSEDRNTSFVPLVVFALLGFVHPRTKLGFDDDTQEDIGCIILETDYLAKPGLSMTFLQLSELGPLRRHLTTMLIESMIQTSDIPHLLRHKLLRTAFKRKEAVEQWENRPMIHALHDLVTAHHSGEAVLYDDAVVATTDLLFREATRLKAFNYSSLVSTSTSTLASGAEKDAKETASAALTFILEKSDNKKCLDTAVRAVLKHTNNCSVDSVLEAATKFAQSFQSLGPPSAELTKESLLHMCCYARILASMAMSCTNPSKLAQSLEAAGSEKLEATLYHTVEAKIQLLTHPDIDIHIRAFGIASLEVWKFACPQQGYRKNQTANTPGDLWDIIVKYGENNLRSEALQALLDTTTLLAAVNDSVDSVSSSEAQLLLRLLGRSNIETEQQSMKPALALSTMFWGLSLDQWSFWTPQIRKRCWRTYVQPVQRRKDMAAMLLLGLSRLLSCYARLKLDPASIKIIAVEIDNNMREHANHPNTLTLPFLSGFDVRRHVREAVRCFLQETESDGPFTMSTSATRGKLRSAVQYDGGEAFVYEEPQPFNVTRRETTGSFAAE
ncbi:hypothetical protein FRC12_005967 [Ceratobasidium sp. 428]|nr:hypothetical protein FRC12_005967 [Ceratobasidium sp. 428]